VVTWVAAALLALAAVALQVTAPAVHAHFHATGSGRGALALGLAYPVGAAVYGWALARSAWVTLRQGGIRWRDTFYRLIRLRAGLR
jgi:membrane protease YdiL (CAAX protease family)